MLHPDVSKIQLKETKPPVVVGKPAVKGKGVAPSAHPTLTSPPPESASKSTDPRIKKVGRWARNALLLVLPLIIGYKATRKDVVDIPFPHDGEEFTMQDLTLEEKVAQLMHSSMYGSRGTDRTDRIVNRDLVGNKRIPLPEDFTDWLTDWLKSDTVTGGIHIFRSDARSLQEARRTAIEQLSKGKIPPFISMDIVGGYTRHLGITRDQAAKFGVPAEFIQLAKKHNIELPTQEDLGSAFEKCKTNEERYEFRKKMMEYGAAISRICKAVGVNINFSPVMDLVTDKDGDSFAAKNDETYGNKIHTVMSLSFFFIKGFQEEQDAAHTLIVPKHFVGTGMMQINPHEDEKQKVTDMEGRDGSVLPFQNAIEGRLFTTGLHPQAFPFDAALRRILLDVKYWETIVDARKRSDGDVKKAEEELENCHAKLNTLLKKNGIDPETFSSRFFRTDRVSGIMVGHAQNFTNPQTPGTLHRGMITKRLQQNLGFNGIIFTDDLKMGAVTNHERESGNGDDSGELFVRALSAGVTIPMMLHNKGAMPEIVERVRHAIETNEDIDHDGTPDITAHGIDDRVQKILDAKVSLGLLSRETRTNPITGEREVVYKNTAKKARDQILGTSL
ncbi:MAG: glycoside hydrolase family 3 N-terminal domain-containing protein [Candidatus Gracilibacteria bacterium]